METKVVKQNKLAIIPAGIIDGVEAFCYKGEKWVAIDRQAIPYHEAPGRIQRMIANAFLNDKPSQDYLKNKMGITSFEEGFEKWYHCVVGAWDNVPDFLQGKFTADGYSSHCLKTDCIHRGKFCSVATGLRHWEVATINALKLGLSVEKTAPLLNISVSGLKSRIQQLKEKLDAKNERSLMAKATELGI